MRTLRICIVGMGRHGRGCFLALQWLAKSRMFENLDLKVSFCSSNAQVRSGNWAGLQAPNLGIPLPEQVDLTDVEVYETRDQVQADMVWICSPTSEHRRLAEFFLGKDIHVLLEKPIALNLTDSDAVLDAARKSKGLLMVGHELLYFADFHYLWQAVRTSGSPLKELRLIRQISSCDGTAGADKVPLFGGPVVDLHIHDVHAILLLLGVPQAVQCEGAGDKDANYLAHGITQYGYGENGPHVVSSFGAVDEWGLMFRHGFECRFENGRQLHYRFNVMASGMYAMPPMTQHEAEGGNVGLVVLPKEEIPDNLGPLVRELREALLTVTSSSNEGTQWCKASPNWKPTSPLCPLTAARALEFCLLERHSWKAECALQTDALPTLRNHF